MDNMHLDQHISKQFNDDLENIRSALLEMGGMVEKQVQNAVQALQDSDTELAQQVLQMEEDVDHKEVEIDMECTEVLARRQPAASDLRLVLIITKAIRDLERIGDEATKIARMAIELSANANYANREFVEIRHLASKVQGMLHGSLDAFARFDTHDALQVLRDDKIVDREYKSAIREMITLMMEDPRSISHVLNIIWALRALERVGDHAQNIAEHVIFLVKGKDVRHKSVKKIEKQLDITK